MKDGLTTLGALARLELAITMRRRWVRLFTVVFAVLSAAIAYGTAALDDSGGPDGLARMTVAVIPPVLILVPLAALLVGISGQSDEPSGEAFLFAQPVSRSQILLGRWLGQSVALGGAMWVGFAVGAFIVGSASGVSGLGGFAIFVLIATLLSTIFLSVAALVAVLNVERTTALGAGCGVWFVFVILHDALALWLAGMISGPTGARVLFTSVLLNPVDTGRVAMLSLAGTPHVLGAAGEAWELSLGGSTWATVVAFAVLLLWAIAPLEWARRRLARRDLYA
jgi:Cu-processing system permease protein